MTQKSIPYAIEAEETLLGNILLYPESIRETIEAGITSDDFYLDKHKKLFSIISSMYENREKIDPVSVSTKLKDFDYFDKVGGSEFLLQLTESTVDATNTREYIRIIKNKSLARRIIKAGEEIANDGYDGKTSIDDILEEAEKKILNVTRSRMDSDFKKGSDVFDATVKKIEKIQESGTGVTGVRSLYEDLDRITHGFQNGDLIILAARPSMGKTALALNFAINSAQVSQGAVCIFSLEMPAEQLAMRMFSAKTGVKGDDIRTAHLNDAAWSKINEAVLEMKNQKFYIDDSTTLKVQDMFAKCRKLKNEVGLSLVIVDYIQLIESSGIRSSESRQQEVSEISRKLKAMARELEVPVIVLSQLSRNVERKENKRPMLSDLRESGAIEQDADIVMFIYREEYYAQLEGKAPEQKRQDAEIIIAKHRNGATGTIKLAFEKDINAFYGIKNYIPE